MKLDAILKEIEKVLNESLLFTIYNENLIIVSNLTNNHYSFLQKIQQFKAKLYKYRLSFKPISRLTQDIVVMRIVER